MAAWLEIAIPAAPEGAEDAAALLAGEVAAAARGTELRPGEIVFWVPVADGEAALAQTRDAARRLAAAGVAIDAAGVHARPAVPEEEWRDAWKRHFRTIRLTRQIVVVPSWDQVSAEPGDAIIHLDPGQAFGTGAHATTRLLLELLQRARDRGTRVRRFLDVGTGSGILAIAAALLWPDAKGVAVDVDPIAVKVAAENAAANQVSARIDVSESALEEVPGRFELVLANIQRDVLLDLREPLADRVAAGGLLLLSGLLAPQAAEVAARYAERPELSTPTVVPSTEDPEWSAIELVAGQGQP